MFSRPGARGDSSAGDQRQASCHTTHNVFVLLLFFFSQLTGEKSIGATRIGDLPSIFAQETRRSRARCARVRAAEMPNAMWWHVELDRLVALMLEPARRARRDDAVPPRPDREVGTGGLSVIRGIGGSSTWCPATHS